MTITELQRQTDHWIKTIGVRYFNELTNMAVLTEEVGELAKLLSRTYGEQSFKKNQKPADIKSAIADELADIIFVVSCLANQMEIDLEESITTNFQKKTTRDVTRHKNNDKLSQE